MDKNRYQTTNPGGLENTKEENISPQAPPQLNKKNNNKNKNLGLSCSHGRKMKTEEILSEARNGRNLHRGRQIKRIVDKQEENRVKYFVLIKNKCKYKIFYLLLNIPTNKWKNIKKLEALNKICVGIPPYLCIFWKFKIISKSLKLNQCRKQPPKKKKNPSFQLMTPQD